MNKKTSIYTTLYWLTEEKKINSDIIFNFLDFFWPKFITHKEHIFLKENFSEEKFHDLQKQDANMLEFWMNLLLIESYFQNDSDWEEKSKFLAKSLVDIWRLKLKNEFPNNKFIVNYIEDAKNGDYGLTFHQDI